MVRRDPVALMCIATAGLFAAFALVGCFTVVGWAAERSSSSQTITKNLKIAPGTTVDAVTTNGSVNVTAWDKPEVELSVEKRVQGRGLTDAEAREKLDAITLDIQSKPERLRIVAHMPSSRDEVNYAADITLRVPKGLALMLKTTNGRVTVADAAGPVEARTTNGSVHVTGANHAVFAETTNGSITCSGAVSRLKAATTNGSIKVECSDAAPADGLSCTTTNGSVQLALPKDASFDLAAQTSTGSIHSEFPVTVQGEIVSKRVKAKVGQGGPAVDLATVNGGITVKAM